MVGISDADTGYLFIQRIRAVGKQIKANTQPRKQTHLYELRAAWWDAFTIYLQDLLAVRHPGRVIQMITVSEIQRLMEEIGEDDAMTWTRNRILDAMEGILKME